jgi:serine/threonine-protein kinase
MDHSALRAQLERILASPPFRASRRIQRFLTFTVEETLAGRGELLKETLVGTAVFDRPIGYDPRLDGIVRVEARRLRAKLREYYESHGAADPIRIEYPSGCYAPLFESPPAASAPAMVRTDDQRTIAVMPLANLSAEPDTDYFADGLTQELIHMLTRIPSLRVIAWNSVNRLRDQPRGAREVGQQLRADAILEGSVRHAGSRVRITVQLVEGGSGVVLWAHAMDRELKDLIAVQEELARSIAMVLRVSLDAGATTHPSSSVGNVEAYSLYLRGRSAWNRRTEEGLRQSVIFFTRAIELDERCAVAHAGLADAYNLLCDFGLQAVSTSIPLARAAAVRALELDPTLAEAHNSLGFIASMHDWDWELGERYYRQAIALRPSYATAHHWYGCDLLALKKRFPEAMDELNMAIALDPLEPNLIESTCYVHLLAREYDEAERLYLRFQKQWPEFWKGYTGLGRVLAAQGRYREAAEMIERGRAIIGDTATIVAALAHVYGMWGNQDQACRFFTLLQQISARRHVSCVTSAIGYLGTNDKSTAIRCLERAAENREPLLTAIAVHPAYDELRGNARFQGLLARIGLS